MDWRLERFGILGTGVQVNGNENYIYQAIGVPGLEWKKAFGGSCCMFKRIYRLVLVWLILTIRNALRYLFWYFSVLITR